VKGAIAGNQGDDGLLQRFSLTVWPDQSGDWREVDKFPDTDARNMAWKAFQRLDEITPDSVGAASDAFEDIPSIRFDEHASGFFREWWHAHEKKVRAGNLHPALESHLSKYRKLVPALALINHLTDGGGDAVGVAAVQRAYRFAGYLETHARRLYASGMESGASTAKAIIERIRKRQLQDGFTAYDITQRDWSQLKDAAQVKEGLDLLADYNWLADFEQKTRGRPKVIYFVNPDVFK
jgi:hypothetical protein